MAITPSGVTGYLVTITFTTNDHGLAKVTSTVAYAMAKTKTSRSVVRNLKGTSALVQNSVPIINSTGKGICYISLR